MAFWLAIMPVSKNKSQKIAFFKVITIITNGSKTLSMTYLCLFSLKMKHMFAFLYAVFKAI